MSTFEHPKSEYYENRLVAFIDVLGFENRVKDVDAGEQDFKYIANLLGSMKKIESEIEKSHFKEVIKTLEVSLLSDSLIISAKFEPDNKQSILDFLFYVKSIQIHLIGDHQTLTRGYLCAGKMYHRNNVVFGVPYMTAYQNEKSVKGPKIAIDPDLEGVIAQADSETIDIDLKDLTRRDEDGWRFVNYLQDPNLPQQCKPYTDVLPEITKWLWKQLRTQRGDVLEKYRWLEGYINELIRENKCPDAEVTTLAFLDPYKLTTTLQKYAGQRVYFHDEEWGLLEIHCEEVKLLGTAIVPSDVLTSTYDIRSDKLFAVKEFLTKLGAYSAEAEKIILTKSEKDAGMK
jgi:hypothetical protein